ncbi:hypothetical protein XH79_07090 [Bradyrhizobium sp. CCBAU 45389]|nr:hypothetical protein [Bradyrhizobium sp. CCBAU 45389]
MSKGKPTSKEVRDAGFRELAQKLAGWDIPTEAIDTTQDSAKASLAEVKALTEYEDGKASRLLTIIAFLSAVVGAVFTRFVTDYPWPDPGSVADNKMAALTIGAYAAFLAYVLLVTISVIIILKAVKPTLNVPKSWDGAPSSGLPGRAMVGHFLACHVVRRSLSVRGRRAVLRSTYPKWRPGISWSRHRRC